MCYNMIMMNLVHDESSVKATDCDRSFIRWSVGCYDSSEDTVMLQNVTVWRSDVTAMPSENHHRSWIQIHLRCTIMSSEFGYDAVAADQKLYWILISVKPYCFRPTAFRIFVKLTIYKSTLAWYNIYRKKVSKNDW